MKFNPGKTFGWLLLLAATVLILSVTGIVPGWAMRMIVSWQALFVLLLAAGLEMLKAGTKHG
jgi:hypothetical protein